MYTNLIESEFFTKGEYDLLGCDFNFEVLAKLTNKALADEILSATLFYNIKRFAYRDRGKYLFLDFFADKLHRKDEFLIIRVYYDKKHYFHIQTIDYLSFEELGLGIVVKDKEGDKTYA